MRRTTRRNANPDVLERPGWNRLNCGRRSGRRVSCALGFGHSTTVEARGFFEYNPYVSPATVPCEDTTHAETSTPLPVRHYRVGLPQHWLAQCHGPAASERCPAL